MKCIHFLGIYLFILAIPFSSQLSNIRSIQNLIKNFDNNIDINFLFYSYHQQQYQNPYKCSAEYGPYCKFINNKSLLGIMNIWINWVLNLKNKRLQKQIHISLFPMSSETQYSEKIIKTQLSNIISIFISILI